MKPVLRILPVPFWCYMIPMLATSIGILPSAHPLYNFLSQQLLPVCLVLLLIGADLKGVYRLGPKAITLMLCGAAGTMLGGIASFKLYERWLPEGSWAGVGALTASWTGGSANLVAVKEALSAPDPLIAPIIIVDAAVAYTWMGFLIWASAWQNRWDQRMVSLSIGNRDSRVAWPDPARVQAERGTVLGLLIPLSGARPEPRVSEVSLGLRERCWAGLPRAGSLLFAIFLSWIAQGAGGRLPTFGTAMSPMTWTILIVTTVSLALSLTRLRSLGDAGASKLGTFFLYVILASIGARSNLRSILEAPIFLALGATWIVIHGVCLITAGYFLKAPLGLIATTSQANIGGTISAPIVGATYHPKLATVGLLMAILGNILGTYLGLATAFLLRYN